MASQPRLLITGINGFLGWNLYQVARGEWDMVGTASSSYHSDMPSWVHQADLTDYSALKKLMKTLRPDAVIHLAAMSQPNDCQENPEASKAINIDAAANLAGLCADVDIPFAFSSTDLVFDGKIDGTSDAYTEESPVNPISAYGEHKAIAEEKILERYDLATICRMPLMFGACAPPARSMIQGMISALQNDQVLNLFCDEYRTPISGQDAARGLLFALENAQGRLHLGGRDRVSRLDIGTVLAAVMGVENPQLKSCYQFEVQMSAPRPKDVSLNSEKAFALGFDPTPLLNAIEATFALHQTLNH